MISSELTINTSEAWVSIAKAGVIKSINSIFSNRHKSKSEY